MNESTPDPQKDAQATEEMLAMLEELEQDETGGSPDGTESADEPDSAEAAAQVETPVTAEQESESATQAPADEQAEIPQTTETPEAEDPAPRTDETPDAPAPGSAVEDDEQDDTPPPPADAKALPEKALQALEAAAELKEEAEELAAEAAELKQETATVAAMAVETLQDETDHIQTQVEDTLNAAEQAFDILRDRGASAALSTQAMDEEALMQKLAELEARNQKLRERNEIIKARLATLK